MPPPMYRAPPCGGKSSNGLITMRKSNAKHFVRNGKALSISVAQYGEVNASDRVVVMRV